MDRAGNDTAGRSYASPDELWKFERERNGGGASAKLPWYSEAVRYWKEVPATVDGVLGGLGFVSGVDAQGSLAFLSRIFGTRDRKGRRALDCGAGVGRVTREVLSHVCEDVDLVDPCDHFLQQARQNLVSACDAGLKARYFAQGLEEFEFDDHSYDIIWIQWVIGHLTDEDLAAFLARCRSALREGGVVFVKDNTTSAEGGVAFTVDREDSSVTRSDKYIRELFASSGYELVDSREQDNLPEGLFPVFMYAFAPCKTA